MTRTRIVVVAAAVALGACNGTGTEATQSPPQTSTTTTTTAAPTTTTTTTIAPAPISYAHVIPVGPDGVEYKQGGEDLEAVGPSQIAITADQVYIVDPAALELWLLGGTEPEQWDLAAEDILNVTAMAASSDRLYLVEVLFAPARQRLHELTLDGELLATSDLAPGAQLEDGLSGLIVDDDGEVLVVLAGGAAFAHPTTGAISASVTVGGSTFTQQGPDIDVDGTLLTADLASDLGGLRLLGATEELTVLIREEVTSLSPIEVVATIEWYDETGFVGSALIPLEAQAIPSPPGLVVAPDGTVVVLVAGPESVTTSVVTPEPSRITAGS